MMNSMYQSQSEHTNINQRPREPSFISSPSPNNNFHQYQLRRRSSIEGQISIAGSSSCSISSLMNEIDDWSITREIYGMISPSNEDDIDDAEDASLDIDTTLHKPQQQPQAPTTKVIDNNFKRMSSDETSSTSTALTVSLSCSDRSSDYLSSSSDHSLFLLKGIDTTPSTSSSSGQHQLDVVSLSRDGSDRSIKSNDNGSSSSSSSTLHLLAATPSREDNKSSSQDNNEKKNNKVVKKKPHTELRKKHHPRHRCPKVNQGVTGILKKHSKYSPSPSLSHESIKSSVGYTKSYSRRSTQETVTSTTSSCAEDLCLLGQSSSSTSSSTSSSSSSHKSSTGRLTSLISDKLKKVMPHRKRISNTAQQQEQQQEQQEEEDGIKSSNSNEHESSVLCHSTSSSSSSFFNKGNSNGYNEDPLYSDDWLPKLVEFSESMEIYVFRV